MSKSQPESVRPTFVRPVTVLLAIALLAGLLVFSHRGGRDALSSPQPIAKPLDAYSLPSEGEPPPFTDRIRTTLETEHSTRIDALRAIGDDLTASESLALLGLLLKSRDPATPEGNDSVTFHETALALHRQAAIREDFAKALATVARDPGREPVIRDYGIQHLGQLWASSEPDLAASIEATLAEFADSSPTIAPSALLALHSLASVPHPGASPVASISNDLIAPKVRTMLAGSDFTAARMTALRIIGERRLDGFQDELERLAGNPAAGHTLVRMAAVAAIARFADPADLPLLRGLERSDPRMATAIDHAITRIESKP